MTKSFLIDTHSHLQDKKFAGEEAQIIDNAAGAGIGLIINAGTCVENSEKAVALAEKFSCCRSLAGIHPHDAKTFNDNSISALKEMAQHPSVLGIGEIGLDFHYDFSPRDVQISVFKSLWQLAAELQMPAIIHVREAFSEFFDAIMELPRPREVILHCFSGDLDTARKAADMGFHFSIGGALTFPKSDMTRQVFTWLPEDVIHLETDCPYLAPQPRRGKRNEPAYLQHTFEFLATLRQVSRDQLKDQLYQNACNFFGEKIAV